MAVWVSHSPYCSFNLQPFFVHLNFCDSGAVLPFCKGISTVQSVNKQVFLSEAEWTSSIRATIFIGSVALPLRESQPGDFSDIRFSLLM